MDPTQTMIHYIEISNDLLFAANGEYRVDIYDIDDLQFLKSLETGWETRALAINDKYIFVGSLGPEILIFDKSTYEKIGSLPHPMGVNSLTIYDDKLYSLGYGENVYIWDTVEMSLLAELPSHNLRVNAIEFFDSQIVTGDGFKTYSSLKFWDPISFTKTREIDLETNRINSIVKFDNKLIIATGAPSIVYLYNIDGSKEKLLNLKSEVRKIIKIKDQIFILTGNKIVILGPDFSEMVKIENPYADIVDVTFSKNKYFFASRNVIQSFNPNTGELGQKIEYITR